MNDLNKAKRIAELVSLKGGRAYFVGGYVRDKILGKTNKDIDIEVHGIEPSVLYDIISSVGEVLVYGSNFGIYSMKYSHLDVAMPRMEKSRGTGHKDFEVFVDPYIGTYEACKRRDFTINSMLEDILTGEVIDYFGGKNDLVNKVIRHTNTEKFSEDPLRVLRACQFAPRFNFTIADETIKLCQSIDLTTLSKERVYQELIKSFEKSEKPSLFFKYLREMNQLDYWFKEVKDLIGVKQNPDYHAEGDVFDHTMLVLDNAKSKLDKVHYKNEFMLACLCHDMGKSVATKVDDNGKISSIGHEEVGVLVCKEFLKRITNEKKVIRYCVNMVENHMKPNKYAADNSKLSTTNKMFNASIDGNDLIILSECDALSSISKSPYVDKTPFLFNRLSEYDKIMAMPYVNGHELLDLGITNRNRTSFNRIISYLKMQRLNGMTKKNQFTEAMGLAKQYGIFDADKYNDYLNRKRVELLNLDLIDSNISLDLVYSIISSKDNKILKVDDLYYVSLNNKELVIDTKENKIIKAKI